MITTQELNALREKALPKIALRKKVFADRVPELKERKIVEVNPGTEKTYRAHILCCAGTGCKSSGSDVLRAEFERVLEKYNLQDEVKIVKTGCFGLCAEGPIVVVYPEDAMYCKVSPEDIEEIVTEHIMNGRIVRDSLKTLQQEKKRARSQTKTSRAARSLRSRCVSLCTTADGSIPKTSKNTSRSTVTRHLQKLSQR